MNGRWPGEGPVPATVGVEVVRAWPRRHEAVRLQLPAGATVADAVRACGLSLDGVAGHAVFGELAAATRTLRDGEGLGATFTVTLPMAESASGTRVSLDA
jgi:hypothetical protein